MVGSGVHPPDRLCAGLCLGAALAVLAGAGAASAQPPLVEGGKRTMQAVRIDRALTVDGRLDEPEWQLATPAADFAQKEPRDDQPASERTEVRILYNQTFLYVGVTCFDSEPDRILINQLVEDHSMSQEDSISVLIDSFNDGLSDVQFETNAAGSRADTQHSANGAISNRDWDTIWDVKTSRGPDGWVAEFAIPFKSLRFNAAIDQVWGINFRRRIRRKNEEAVWNPIPRGQNFWTPSLAGRLEGLRGLRPGRSLYIKPFALGGVSAPRGSSAELSRDAGVDLKYGITNGLTLDATYRTDFAQTEVDEQQVNLTRFSLFFPEKREFFLENAGIFSFAGQGSTAGGGAGFGSGGGGTRVVRLIPFGTNDFILFFSRRIGLSPTGRPVPVRGGARLTGRLAGRVDLGVLNVASDAAPGVPAATYSVVKVRQALFHNSDMGVMFIDREASGGRFNRVVGVEQNFRFLSNALSMNSFWARSFTPDVTGHDQAWGVSTTWRDRTKNVTGFFREVGSGFNNEVGFVRRRGIRQGRLTLEAFLRPGGPGFLADRVREVSPQLELDYVMSGTNRLLTRTLTPAVAVLLHSGAKLTVSRIESFDRVERPFVLGPDVAVPAGDYRFGDTQVEYLGDESRPVAARAALTVGDFYGGSRRGGGAGLVLRPNHHLSLWADYTRNVVELPSRRFTTHLGLLSTNVAFTPDLNLTALVQYNSDSRRVLSNIRFRYIYRPWSDFYIVYNETRDVFGHREKDRALTVKLTYAFSL